eukprot:2276671-Pyramimonas_sp.AAC.1
MAQQSRNTEPLPNEKGSFFSAPTVRMREPSPLVLSERFRHRDPSASPATRTVRLTQGGVTDSSRRETTCVYTGRDPSPIAGAGALDAHFDAVRARRGQRKWPRMDRGGKDARGPLE